MNSMFLCFSVSAFFTLALVKPQVESFKEDFLKVERKRSTVSKDYMLPYCPPLPEVDDDKPKETIDEYCLLEDRRKSLKKIADLKDEIISLKKEVNEEKNSKTLLQSQNLEFYQMVTEEKNKTAILQRQNLELNQMVNEEKNKTAILQKQSLELKQRIQELFQNGTQDIFEASMNGSLSAVKYWYAIDPATIHGKNAKFENWTPLHYASDNGHLDIVEFLLSKGADLEAEDSSYITPLIRASYKGHVPVVQALLDKGANIKHQNKNKWTPLHWAVFNVVNDQLPVVKLLIERGADRSLTNISNQTPLDLARIRGNQYIEDYLSSL